MPARKAKICIPDIAKEIRKQGVIDSIRDGEEILKIACQIIRQKLVEGESVYLDGFGTFRPSHHKMRLVHDVHDGPPNVIKAGNFISFKGAGGNRLTSED